MQHFISQDTPENSDSVGRTFESCRAYQMQEIRTYSSLWEMCSDFFFLMALFLVEMHSAAALWQLKKEV